MLHRGTIFNDNFQRNIVAQKIDTCVTWRLQTIFNATFVATTRRTTLDRLEILATLLQ